MMIGGASPRSYLTDGLLETLDATEDEAPIYSVPASVIQVFKIVDHPMGSGGEGAPSRENLEISIKGSLCYKNQYN